MVEQCCLLLVFVQSALKCFASTFMHLAVPESHKFVSNSTAHDALEQVFFLAQLSVKVYHGTVTTNVL